MELPDKTRNLKQEINKRAAARLEQQWKNPGLL